MHWQEGGGRGCVYTHGNCRRNLTARALQALQHVEALTCHYCVSLLHLLPLLLMWMPPVCADDSAVTVNVLSMMYNPEYYVEKVNAINAGFDASLSAHGWKTGSGATISVIRPPSYNTTAEDIFQLGVKQSEGKLLVVFGPLGTDPVVWVRDKLKENDLVAIAPIAYSSEVRGWNPHLYSISVEPNAELLALIRYAVVYLGLPRVGLMYAKGNGFDKESYEFTMRIMEIMGRKPCGVFAVESSGGRDVLEGQLNTKWGQFVATRPQAVLLFSSLEEETTGWFVKKIAQDNRTVDMYLLAPSSFQHFLIKTWSDALVSLNRTFTPGQLITTGTVPLASDNRSSMVRHFQRDMDNYLDTNSDWKGFAKPEHYLKDDKLGEMMVFGWLAGEVLFEALNNAPQLTNRTSFMESLYKQRRYVIDDFVVGDFGGECDEALHYRVPCVIAIKAAAWTHMRVVDDSLSLKPMKKGSVTWSVSECSSANVQVSAPLIGLYVVLTDDKVAQRASMRWSLGARSIEEADDVDKRIFFHSLKVNLKNLTQSLEQVRDTKAVAAVLGVTADILSVPNMTFIGPIPLFPRLNKFWRNVIHLQPLLAHELYVLAVYLSNTSSTGVKALVRGGEASEVVDTLDKSLVTFGVSLDSSKTLGDGDPMSSYLSGNGDVFCIGLTPPDVAAVARHLQTHLRARVFVPFNDILLFYQEFVAGFNASKESIASSEGLLFATSFPHWGKKNRKSDMVARFHRHVNESHWDPLTFLGFATTRLLQVVISNMRKVNAEPLADRIYTESNIRVDDVGFGPFSDAECVSGTSVSANECASNFGATNISVWSMGACAEFKLAQDTGWDDTVYGLCYSARGSTHTVTDSWNNFWVCIRLVIIYCPWCVPTHLPAERRNNNRAPKEPTDPVTLIFTDIESSTALWAAHPDLMPDAVAAHHRMVRSLIGRYKCYEVKTVGDSFMIASKSPFAAVQLAQELQLCFLHHDWGTNALDDSYREFEEQRAEGECEYTPPTAHMDPEVYSRLWNGLRVRVGIHTGLCDIIRHDEVTKGYDYYGRTPNMAARTESVANGGQVLMTHAAYMSLSAEDRKQIDVTALGDVALRGVSDPVKMYQLNTVPSRNFAALRLDREYFFDEGEDGTTTSTSDHSSSRADVSESGQIIATALQSLLSTFKTAHREKLLLPYCERWRVPLPRKAASEWDDAYCEEVVRRIAVKVGRVADHGADSGSESSSTQGSSSIIIVPFYDMHLQEY
uniref:Receptor-type adenylate cyclase GRESAG 4.1 n=1 Tax=Trypanosoma brucei brucei TaxID=5702 RepID=CY41_TRYBB|nr:RecName: Full=Receptor-type adenylate cyclase GRESAG 4.1; AltName: Full=ATP pyrophosphate-lyase; AltName: Full=Adenylyl cyclase [Trypanosoma brucei brucei]CAA36364.1 putative adenyl/guanylyl cyclase [Trypanosoma brucei]